MGIPFKVSAESVKNTDKTGCKMLRFVHIVKQSQNGRTDSREKTIQQRTVFIEEDAEILINSENTMTMNAIHKLKGHSSGTVNCVFSTTGRTKSAFTTERNEF